MIFQWWTKRENVAGVLTRHDLIAALRKERPGASRGAM